MATLANITFCYANPTCKNKYFIQCILWELMCVNYKQ